jgi:uncharacterized protein (TIGR03118 family)
MRRIHLLVALAGLASVVLAPAPVQADYVQTNLVSDGSVPAVATDTNLVNPWGVSFSATSPFWVSDQGTNKSTVYTVTPSGSVTISGTMPTIPQSGFPQGPTGQVNNGNTSAFILSNGMSASFIFASLDGRISGWNGAIGATGMADVRVSGSAGSIYTGLAIGASASGPTLYAANNSLGRIDVYNSSFTPTALTGNFTNPMLPAGLKPFNIQNIGGLLYVTYSTSYPGAAIAPLGSGAVAVFDLNGNFIRQITDGGQLSSPWGVAVAPSTFGQFANDLLVGNFSYANSFIDAYDPVTGAFLGTLTDASGNPIIDPGLWALTFGNGGSGGSQDILYFTAGIGGEAHGLFGALTPGGGVPEPGTVVLFLLGAVGLLVFSRRRRAGRT